MNAVPSDDPKYGWGGAGGYVYQKSYLEFFVSPERLNVILSKIDDWPSLRYIASDSDGNSYSNMRDGVR